MGLVWRSHVLCRFMLGLFAIHVVLSQAPRSSKRGLVHVPSDKGSDDAIWTSGNSDLTWYYNYAATPSTAYVQARSFEFVPMLWGAGSANETGFLDAVLAQIKSGANITAVLAFNEPDGGSSTGGSNISPSVAAEAWKRQIEPLKSHGIKLGAPAVTGAPSGFTWLQNFSEACQGKCSFDFIPIHWYGNFEGLASHLGQVRAAYMIPIWVTEYAIPNASLQDSQVFYNQSSQYLDRLDYVERYSYFGSFRSSVSNVGPNAAMLTQDGKLTDIGSWYLGSSATGNTPSSARRSILPAPRTLVLVSFAMWRLF